MTFSAIQFQAPFLLILLPLPLLLALLSRRLEILQPTLTLPRASVARGLPRTLRTRFRSLPMWLSTAALTLIVIALARPQKGLGRDQLTTEGVDIVVALDVSGSMAAQDFQPDNRLSVAKSVVADFIRKRTRDRVGLVIFAGRAITQSPATTDQALLLRQLEGVALDRLPDGTAIGSGLATALSRLSKSEAKTKVVVLVTDGANNSGEIDPDTATDIAKAMEVKIYTVGVGKGGIAPIPVRARDPFTGQIVSRTVNMEVPIDEDLLKRIAERTGGAFFSATNESSFRDIFGRIDALETSRLKSISFRRFQELFPPFLTAATVLLLLAGFLWARGLRVLPRLIKAPMTLASPLWLVALLLIPALAWLGTRVRRADRERMDAMVTASMFERIGRRFPARVEALRTVFVLAGAALLVLALARPQWGIVRERVERSGVDVALVLDTSLSMSVEDVSPNRFFLAKQSLSALMSRLTGDRFSLVAFEGEAYPLVPQTLDADAVALFLETLEPGFVPTPGSNLLSGIEAGIATFVDPSRVNRVIVLASDGEDLEESLEAAVSAAKKAGVIIHTVGVGSIQGGPVPETDSSGARNGYKLQNGEPVISRLNPETLIRLAQSTGGKFTQAAPNNTSVAVIASAIEAMENKQTASEFSFRKKERFQIPLGLSLVSFLLALFGPVFLERLRLKRARLALVPMLLLAATAHADLKDEILARPSRETNKGLKAYETGDAAQALVAFEKARAARPDSAVTRFNEAVAQVKSGKGPEAIETFTALSREKNDLGFESHYNLGNALLGAQQLPGAVAAYRDALRLKPDDARARRNLEIALRQLQQQKKDQEKDQKDQKDQKDKQQQKQPSQGDGQKEPQKTQKERENERFQKETGMSKERAMQLLKALEQNEKTEQKKKLEAERAKRRKGKDW